MPEENNNNVVSSVITHAGQIAVLEERQKAHEQDFNQELTQVREDLYTAIEESIQGYTKLLNAALARIDALEEQVTPEKAQKASAPAPGAKPDASNEKSTAPATSAPGAPGSKPGVKVEEPAPAFRLIRRNGRLVKRAS